MSNTMKLLYPYADPLCIPILYRAILRHEDLPFKQHLQLDDHNASRFLEARLPASICPVTQFFERIVRDRQWIQTMLATGHKLILLGPGEDLASEPGHPGRGIAPGIANLNRQFCASHLTLLCMGPDGRIYPLDETVMPLDLVLGAGTGTGMAALSGSASTYAKPMTNVLSPGAYDIFKDNEAIMRNMKSMQKLQLLHDMTSATADWELEVGKESKAAEKRDKKMALKQMRQYRETEHVKSLALRGGRDNPPQSRSLEQPLATDMLPSSSSTIAKASANPGNIGGLNDDMDEDEVMVEAEKLYMPNNDDGRGTKRTAEEAKARNVKPAYRGLHVVEQYPNIGDPNDEATRRIRSTSWTVHLAIGLSFETLREPLWIDYDTYLPWVGWKGVRPRPDHELRAFGSSNTARFETVPAEERIVQTAYAMIEQGRCVIGSSVACESWDWGGEENGDCMVVSTTCTYKSDISKVTWPAPSKRKNLFFHLRGVSACGD